MQGTAHSNCSFRSLRGMTEDDVIALAKQGSGDATEYLLHKYQGLVEAKARSYFLMGAEPEDVIQEGMIGLFKAIRDFSLHEFGGFRKFAALCVTRQIISAVKGANRQKHQALNMYVSMDATPDEGEDDGNLDEVLSDDVEGSPVEHMIGKELRRQINREMDRSMSQLEKDALREYLRGHTYQNIAEELGTNVKQVDNALQRAKKKLEDYVPLSAD